MLRIKFIQRVLSLPIKRENHWLSPSPTSNGQGQSTTKVLTEHAVEEEEGDERLDTDDLFFASERLPFPPIQPSEKIFPKARPTLLNPVVDETRVHKSGVCAVPFSQIPTFGGPVWVKLCKLVSDHLPGSYRQSNDEIKLLSWIYPFRKIFDHYGPLVRLHTNTKDSIVILCKPKHIMEVQKSDGTHPIRSIIDSMENYRRSRISITMPEYEIDFSQVAEKFKNHLDHRVNDYQFLCNQLAVDFVKRTYLIRDHRSEVHKYSGELCLWSLKCFSAIVFGRDAEYKQDGYNRIVNTLIEVSSALCDCESVPQLWRFFPTSSRSKLAECFDILEVLLVRNLRMTYLKLGKLSRNVKNETPQHMSLLETMILKEKMTTDSIITTLMDLLVVGVNSIANIAGMAMYYLSKSPDVQDRLYWEINLVLPHETNELFSEDMVHLPLLRACIVETMRLWPPFTHTVRCTTKEIVVNGYTIPKNTNVIMAHQIAFHKDEHFADARKFEPRRWTGRFSKPLDPLEVMPFCHRQHPIIKELAYRQIAVLVAHMVKNFEIEYNYGEMQYNNKILSSPSKPFKFTLKDRH